MPSVIRIEESGMVFEFDDDRVFQIENSELQKSLNEGIKTVECIVRVDNDILQFIEAKSSSPRPYKNVNDTSEKVDEEKKEKFDKFISDICEKFVHSFDMYMSTVHKRNTDNSINGEFYKIKYDTVKFKFILIIKGHEIEWLQPLSDEIKLKLKYHNSIWKSDVVLLNEKMAMQRGIVKELL